MVEESKTKSKQEASRLNVFYVLQVLSKYSDAEHPMSLKEITEQVNKEFEYFANGSQLVSRDTVKRIMEDLTQKIFYTDFESLAQTYGYVICEVVKEGNDFINYQTYLAEQETDEERSPKRYYYYDHSLTIGEIRTLKDAIETYSYFNAQDVTDIIKKLLRLRPQLGHRTKGEDVNYYDVADTERQNINTLGNIVKLNECIMKGKCAEIKYCHYDKNMKLVQRAGYPKKIEPIDLMWSNGYYYLLIYNPTYELLTCYRIDKISDIKILEDKITYNKKDFNPVKYKNEHPIMFSGEPARMNILCRDTGKNYIMNTIMDVFGKNAKISVAKKELLEEHLGLNIEEEKQKGIEWLLVRVDAVPIGVELWATQYCNDCVIISPEESAKKVKERLTQGLEFYSKIN